MSDTELNGLVGSPWCSRSMRSAATSFCHERPVTARVHEICLLTTTMLHLFFDVLLSNGSDSDIEKIIAVTKNEICPALPDAVLEGFSPIHESKRNTLSWMTDQSINWNTVKASVVICSKNVEPSSEFTGILVPVNNPRLIFTKILRKFNPTGRQPKIESTAIIGKNCVLGKNIYIGHFVVLEDNVVECRNILC